MVILTSSTTHRGKKSMAGNRVSPLVIRNSCSQRQKHHPLFYYADRPLRRETAELN